MFRAPSSLSLSRPTKILFVHRLTPGQVKVRENPSPRHSYPQPGCWPQKPGILTGLFGGESMICETGKRSIFFLLILKVVVVVFLWTVDPDLLFSLSLFSEVQRKCPSWLRMLKLACLVRKGNLLLRLPLIQRDPKGERQAEKLDVKVELGEGRRCVVKLVTRGDLPYTGERDIEGDTATIILFRFLTEWNFTIGFHASEIPRASSTLSLSYIYANFHEYQSSYHAARGVVTLFLLDKYMSRFSAQKYIGSCKNSTITLRVSSHSQRSRRGTKKSLFSSSRVAYGISWG